jgi:hypothetical protein
MKSISISRLLAGVVAGVFISFGIAALVVAKGMADTGERAREFSQTNVNLINARVPYGTPALTQASIKAALDIYAIKLPANNIKGPYFDPKLKDRGVTIRHGVGSDPIVYIGSEAFTSWGLLGSTLAHEIEVHCRQNFLAIHLQNIAGFDGTGAAEREAYRYELANSSRFGLAQYDQDLIRSTMSYFYPEQENRVLERFTPVRAWLGKLAANGFSGRLF